MMESFGLYEHLPLFSGELLVDATPIADELITLSQDGYDPEPLMFPPQVDLFSDDPIKPAKNETPPVDNWLEKKLDLINLFSSPNVQVVIQESSSSSHVDASPSSLSKPISEPFEGHLHEEMPQHDLIKSEELLQNVADFLSSDLESSMQYDITFNEFNSSDGLASVMSVEELAALSNPILSPVSPQDIETVLSAGPSSPCSTSSANDGVVPELKTIDADFFSLGLSTYDTSDDKICIESFESYQKPGPTRPMRSSRTRKHKPYDLSDDDYEPKARKKSSRCNKSEDRKERKKQQNKDAALRYRVKKKEEQSGIFDECDQLENKNEELKDKVESMTREIQYLKDLLLEVYKAKGVKPKGVSLK